MANSGYWRDGNRIRRYFLAATGSLETGRIDPEGFLALRHLLLLVTLRKYHKGKSSHRAGDTSSFTHRSLIVSVNKRGDVWIPQRLSKQAKLALKTLDAERLRDFYPRFRAIAGLPDERLARRKASLAGNAELYQAFIENLDKDDMEL